MSPRALQSLEQCDFIAAEDTRVTLKLLNHFGIKKPLISYFEHNRNEQGEKIVSRLLSGESCCLVSDAGMPAISDPGEDLVKLCYEKGIDVSVIPGPCAFISALALSGMSAKRFTFEGFLSVNKRSRNEHLTSLVNEKRTMCFYEAPHKLSRTLIDMAEVFGDRRIAIVREITKIHEEVIHTSLKRAAEDYKDSSLKGEIVIIVEGAGDAPVPEMDINEAVKIAEAHVKDGKSISEAAKLASKACGGAVKKGEIYKLLLGDKNDR